MLLLLIEKDEKMPGDREDIIEDTETAIREIQVRSYMLWTEFAYFYGRIHRGEHGLQEALDKIRADIHELAVKKDKYIAIRKSVMLGVQLDF